MKKTVASLLIFISSFTFSQETQNISGQQFYKQISVGNQKIDLNGGGLREKYWIDLYVAALYLKNKTNDANKIIHAYEEMAIAIKIVSDKVTRERFIETVKEGFAKATAGNASKEQIEAFTSLFSEPIKKGDKINLEFEPSKGIVVKKNYKTIGVVEGFDFKKALFSIWLGSNTVDAALKKGMLGS